MDYIIMLAAEQTLQLFADGGEGSAASGEGSAESETTSEDTSNRAQPRVLYGKQGKEQAAAAEVPTEGEADASPQRDMDAEFEKLIKGEYKDVFKNRTQKIVDQRFKETRNLQEQIKGYEQYNDILESLAERYGVAKDPKALSQALENDDAYLQDAAAEAGLTKQQFKQLREIERENRVLKEAEAQRQKAQQAQQLYTQWQTEAESLKTTYPSLNIEEESRNPEFVSLLRSGVGVKAAYEVCHLHDIMGGAMSYTAQQVEQKTINSIRANGTRPIENGLNSAPAVQIKADPSKWTKEDIREVMRRVEAGEKIRL